MASDDPNEVLQSVWVIGVALVLLSALEAYFAFKIPFFKQEAENTDGQFDMRKYLSLGYLKDNVRTLKADQNIWLSVIGLSLFWGVSHIILWRHSLRIIKRCSMKTMLLSFKRFSR